MNAAFTVYRKISSIKRIRSPNSNVSHPILQLSLPNPLKPGLSREWRFGWSSADRRCSNCIWVINNFIAYKGASYIKELTVIYIWLWYPINHIMYHNQMWIILHMQLIWERKAQVGMKSPNSPHRANSQILFKGLKPGLEGLVVTMHEGACKQHVSIPRPLGRWIRRTVRTNPWNIAIRENILVMHHYR